MIGVSWNCRGLGNPLTVQELTRISNLKQPDFVFLMETKCSFSFFETLHNTLGFDYFHVVDCDSSQGGRRGGLCLMWKETLNMHILSDSLHHIDAEVCDNLGNPQWHLTGLYGWAEDNEKHLTWQLLRQLHTNDSLAWLCFGDLNEILQSSEKVGGNRRTLPKMIAFRDAMESCDLNDLGLSGYQFTWTNKQIGDGNIQERLDRFLANHQWIQTFPAYEVKHLVRFQSDHCPLLLSWNKTLRGFTSRRGKKRFRFEAMWLHDTSCPETVESAWEGHRPASNPFEFRRKSFAIGEALQDSERDNFGNVNSQIDFFHNSLERAQAAPHQKKICDAAKFWRVSLRIS